MRRVGRLLAGLAVAALLASGVPVRADDRLVFGSFQNPGNAENWANRMRTLLGVHLQVVEATAASGVTTYRVVTDGLDEAEVLRVRRIADSRELRYWRLLDVEGETPASGPAAVPAPETGRSVARAAVRPVKPVNPQGRPPTNPPIRAMETLPPVVVADQHTVQLLDLDLGVQTRTFFEEGLEGQSPFHPSLSARLEFYRAWDDERQSLTFTPYYRYDARDDERTHFDMREGFWTLVGDDWDLSVGVKQIFWGVAEFDHLVDIINQTDQVEDLDQEEKLGQPMVHLSLVRDWGILDFHVLTGFRERTYPGPDGRPRFFIPVDTGDPIYESGAGDHRVDGAIRWSHHIGAFEFGIYQFNGTSRAPLFLPATDGNGEAVLRPFYPVINQTGLDAQMIRGDWAFKLESIYRTNFPGDYYALNAGFERTLVGAFGSRVDLGLVMEYMYDQRGDEAFDTFYEHDVALATRWALNDLGDSQALVGLIWDYENHESIVTLEASRRLGQTWMLLMEGRAFLNAGELDPLRPYDPVNKGASVSRDAYIELELTKYF
jgi:hypothetical protein